MIENYIPGAEPLLPGELEEVVIVAADLEGTRIANLAISDALLAEVLDPNILPVPPEFTAVPGASQLYRGALCNSYSAIVEDYLRNSC